MPKWEGPTEWQSKRFRVFKRDRFKCYYCGAAGRTVVLQIDHVVPRSRGGSDDESNLVTACKDCNQGKTAMLLGPVNINALRQVVKNGGRNGRPSNKSRKKRYAVYWRAVQDEKCQRTKAIALELERQLGHIREIARDGK